MNPSNKKDSQKLCWLAGLTLPTIFCLTIIFTLCWIHKGTRVKVSIWRRSVKELLCLYAKTSKSEKCARNTFHYVFISKQDKYTLGCAPPDPPPTRPQHSLQSNHRKKNKRDLVKIRTRITRNRQVSILPYIMYASFLPSYKASSTME